MSAIRFGQMLSLVLLAAPASVYAAEIFGTNCGGAAFNVTHDSKGAPAVGSYALTGYSADAPKEKKSLYLSDAGVAFYASCSTGKSNRALLLFQEVCNSAGCVKDRYGIVDPASMKLLLAPDKKNSGNAKAASQLLGKEVPRVAEDKTAFCCGDIFPGGK